MKTILTVTLATVITSSAFAQGGDVAIRERAKELSRQNDVRQGVPTPAQPQRPQQPATPAAQAPAAQGPKPTATAQESIAKLEATLATFKTTASTPEQRKELLKDVALAMRGKKATLPTVQKFVDSLSAALAEGTLGDAERKRLATDIDTIVNSHGVEPEKFTAMIDDVQAILQVARVKRTAAVAVAADLKAVGTEIRR